MHLFFGLLVLANIARIVSGIPVASKLSSRALQACPPGPDYCAGTNSSSDPRYVCGDSRLGPSELPTTPPLSTLFVSYVRYGGLCPGQFLQKYISPTNPNYWVFPPDDGFEIDTVDEPIEGVQTLEVGSILDRFGAETGSYLSVAGTPFAQRALYPSAINTVNASYPYGYHMYEVVQPFNVTSGPIAPWFEQSGQGTQYETFQTVAKLVATGFLNPVNIGQE